jgi:rhamnosyltransferase
MITTMPHPSAVSETDGPRTAERATHRGAPEEAAAPSAVRVVAVVVTYQPDVDGALRLIEALEPQVARIVVVDNASRAATMEPVRDAVERRGGTFLALPENRGVAAAQNVGIDWARKDGATHVVLSDQDSLPAPDMVEQLLDGLRQLTDAGRRVAAVGPIVVDDRDPDAPLLFTTGRWRPRQTASPGDTDPLVPAAFLLSSGSLIPIEAFDRVGGKRSEWFIDWLDLEWSLRAQRAGLEIVAVRSAHLEHRMGDQVVRVPGRRRRAHLHSADRNYYVARNLVLLIRSDLLPARWRLGYAAWLLRYGLYHLVAVPPRRPRARRLAQGLTDGLRGRTGPRTTTRQVGSTGPV